MVFVVMFGLANDGRPTQLSRNTVSSLLGATVGEKTKKVVPKPNNKATH